MQLEVIKEYQRWADRGYVQPLICYVHELNLIPTLTIEGIVLECPKLCSRRILGGAEYKQLIEKTKMSILLFNNQNNELARRFANQKDTKMDAITEIAEIL